MDALTGMTRPVRNASDRTRSLLPTLTGSAIQQAMVDLNNIGRPAKVEFPLCAPDVCLPRRLVGRTLTGWMTQTDVPCHNCEAEHDNVPLPLITHVDAVGRFVTRGSYCSVGCALADARVRYSNAVQVQYARIVSLSKSVWSAYFGLSYDCLRRVTPGPDPKLTLAKYTPGGLTVEEYRRGWLFSQVPGPLTEAPFISYAGLLAVSPPVDGVNPLTGARVLTAEQAEASRVPTHSVRKRPAVELHTPGGRVHVDADENLVRLREATQRARQMTDDELCALPESMRRVIAGDRDKKLGVAAFDQLK